MHKTILMMILAIVSNSAVAEWIEIGKTEKEEPSTYYADPDTIRKSGNKVKMWTLIDFSTFKVDGFFISAKQKREYDCEEKKKRILFTALYSEHMGGGKTVSIINSRYDWKLVSPDSIDEAVLEYACGFRPELPHTFPDETFS